MTKNKTYLANQLIELRGLDECHKEAARIELCDRTILSLMNEIKSLRQSKNIPEESKALKESTDLQQESTEHEESTDLQQEEDQDDFKNSLSYIAGCRYECEF
jgi:hypothetical protein